MLSPGKLGQAPLRNYEIIAGQLPVKLSTKEAEENPEFVHLLQQLGHLLTSDGVSLDVHKDLKQAEETLRHEKHSWLQSHILHREVQEIILDYYLRDRDTSLTTADREFKEILEQCLNYAEAENYLSFSPDPSSNASLFGLTHTDIQASNPYKKHIPSLQQKLIPELEDRLRKKCENLVNMYHSSTLTVTKLLIFNVTDSSNLALAKTSQLPAMVERSLKLIEEKKEQLKITKDKREKQFWIYFQTLLDSLGMLEKMVSQYRLGSQSRSNTITTEYLTARCDALCLKIKYVEMQILCDTYTAETVAALTKIKEQLQEVTEVKEKDLHRVNLALKAYGAVGFGFDKLAEEYGKLMRERENKEWGLNELAKSKSSK